MWKCYGENDDDDDATKVNTMAWKFAERENAGCGCGKLIEKIFNANKKSSSSAVYLDNVINFHTFCCSMWHTHTHLQFIELSETISALGSFNGQCRYSYTLTPKGILNERVIPLHFIIERERGKQREKAQFHAWWCFHFIISHSFELFHRNFKSFSFAQFIQFVQNLLKMLRSVYNIHELNVHTQMLSQNDINISIAGRHFHLSEVYIIE